MNMVECHTATKNDKNVVCVHVWLRVHRVMEKKRGDQANEMAQGVRELVTKSDNLSLIPGSQTGENQLQQSALRLSHALLSSVPPINNLPFKKLQTDVLSMTCPVGYDP